MMKGTLFLTIYLVIGLNERFTEGLVEASRTIVSVTEPEPIRKFKDHRIDRDIRKVFKMYDIIDEIYLRAIGGEIEQELSELSLKGTEQSAGTSSGGEDPSNTPWGKETELSSKGTEQSAGAPSGEEDPSDTPREREVWETQRRETLGEDNVKEIENFAAKIEKILNELDELELFALALLEYLAINEVVRYSITGAQYNFINERRRYAGYLALYYMEFAMEFPIQKILDELNNRIHDLGDDFFNSVKINRQFIDQNMNLLRNGFDKALSTLNTLHATDFLINFATDFSFPEGVKLDFNYNLDDIQITRNYFNGFIFRQDVKYPPYNLINEFNKRMYIRSPQIWNAPVGPNRSRISAMLQFAEVEMCILLNLPVNHENVNSFKTIKPEDDPLFLSIIKNKEEVRQFCMKQKKDFRMQEDYTDSNPGSQSSSNESPRSQTRNKSRQTRK